MTMDHTRFEITMKCVCGTESQMLAVFGTAGGLVLVGCACGRRFKMEPVDPKEIVRFVVDPCGVTGGVIPEDFEPPKMH